MKINNLHFLIRSKKKCLDSTMQFGLRRIILNSILCGLLLGILPGILPGMTSCATTNISMGSDPGTVRGGVAYPVRTTGGIVARNAPGEEKKFFDGMQKSGERTPTTSEVKVLPKKKVESVAKKSEKSEKPVARARSIVSVIVKNEKKDSGEKGGREERPAGYFETAGKGGEKAGDRDTEVGRERMHRRARERPESSNKGKIAEKSTIVVVKQDGTSEKPANAIVASDGEFDQAGIASWYGRAFDGRPTASGEIYDSRKLTAAHKTLPLGTVILVRNMENDRELVLRVNDRGPFIQGRILDISAYGAERLGYKEKGLTRIGLKIIRRGDVRVRHEGTTRKSYANHERRDMPSSRNKVEKKTRAFSEKFKKEGTLKGYSVQIGVFEKMYNAQSLKYSMRKLKAPIYILKRDGLFVVRVGNFAERIFAEELKRKFEGTGLHGFIAGPATGGNAPEPRKKGRSIQKDFR